jgi:hypothetical protein
MAHYEVIVDNVGQIYDGESAEQALDDFYDYVRASKNQIGHVAGEAVTLMKDGEPIHEHKGWRAFKVGDRVYWNSPLTALGKESQIKTFSGPGKITMMIDKSQARVLLDSGLEPPVLMRDLQLLKKFRIVIEDTRSELRAKVFEGTNRCDAIDAANSDANWQEDDGWEEWDALKTKREICECVEIEE